jgi:hypothetical protein
MVLGHPEAMVAKTFSVDRLSGGGFESLTHRLTDSDSGQVENRKPDITPTGAHRG